MPDDYPSGNIVEQPESSDRLNEVGVSKGGGIFVPEYWKERVAEKLTPHIRETTKKEFLSAAPDSEAQQPAPRATVAFAGHGGGRTAEI
jgi:hypothetical protein